MLQAKKSIFVTVGTTLFEALIEAATKEKALKWMLTNGYTHLIIQYGKGAKPKLPPNFVDNDKFHVELYSFKPSLKPDMDEADMVISHAGAGTVMEALRMKKKHLVVVINTILMDNHQTELANAMGDRGYLFVVENPAKLDNMETWERFVSFEAKCYNGGDEHDFPQILDNFLGFSDKKTE